MLAGNVSGRARGDCLVMQYDIDDLQTELARLSKGLAVRFMHTMRRCLLDKNGTIVFTDGNAGVVKKGF